jgi:uncharacterized protein (TIGR02265 family)
VSAEPVVFAQAMEGLARAFGAELTERARARLRELGVDLARPPLPAYPLAAWERTWRVLAEELLPGQPEVLARRALARRFVLEGLSETNVGKANFEFNRVVGVRRTLERMTRNLRLVNNYTESRIDWLGEREAEVSTWIKPEFLAGWRPSDAFRPEQFEGVLQAILDEVGARLPRVSTVSAEPARRAATYRVSWQA